MLDMIALVIRFLGQLLFNWLVMNERRTEKRFPVRLKLSKALAKRV
jgi:hypothetical protein